MAHIPSDKSKKIDEAIDRWENPNPDNAQAGVNLVKPPSAKELAVFSSVRARTCGDCRFFNREEAQRRLFKQKGLASIVHDYGWKQQHLGAPPEHLGICGDRDDTLTPTYAPACENWRSK